MSQEHRFCAEIYARLFSLIDRTQPIVVSPDGWAHLPNHEKGHAVPDICFTLCGTLRPIRIEAKILQDTRDIKIEDAQREQWRVTGGGKFKPDFWMVARRDLSECWLLEHEAIAARLETKGLSTPLNLWPNEGPPKGHTLDALAILIVAKATELLSRLGQTT